ncbi:hypothetical protein SARC_08816 [Sphaeroforma arctica JP610]|uniref:Uncharacterized protein n=1 Tax=Sphaeroforma arctica JP610 TaxID=667725 RepID=A0A0L0FQE2_9EUKA|nr:hypothetical protein SARC_08816 [Sphaeroforma arctica JP610]KNC78761.1 hypothetical protein SARC_08816 [Sphaeroforma arctica JP610]|eukprot:XP_014152663.1 hypothetical protein SARC_08816 [Sphaeroforma arctica JP610]
MDTSHEIVHCPHNSVKTTTREAEGDLKAEEATIVEEDFLNEAVFKIQDKAAILLVTTRGLSHIGRPPKTNEEDSTDDLEIEDVEDTKIMDLKIDINMLILHLQIKILQTVCS